MTEPTSSPRRRRGLSSISNKLLIALVTVAVVPTVTVSIYALNRGLEALTDRELSQLIDATTRDARDTRDALEDCFRELPNLAGRKAVRNTCSAFRGGVDSRSRGIDEQDWSSFEDRCLLAIENVRAYLDRFDAVSSVLIITVPRIGESRPLIRGSRTDTALEVRRLVERTPDGLVLDVAHIERPEDAPLQQELRREAQAHPHLPWHRATVRLPDDEAYEAFMVEIRGEDNLKIGKVILTVSWRRLLEVHCRGRGVDDSASRRSAALLDPQLQSIQQVVDGASLAIPDDLAEAARDGLSGALQTSDGQLISFAPLSRSRNTPNEFNVLAIRRPASLDEVTQFRTVFASVLASALLLALGLGTYLSRRMGRPLRQLRHGAISFGAGELGHRIEVDTSDEVSEVANAFNRMAHELRSLYEGMEQTIAERTTQLQEALDELRGAHDSLVESEGRYSDIVENAFDLIQVTDPEGRVLRANRRQAELFGRTPAELVGVDFFSLVTPDLVDATRQAFQRVTSGQTLSSYPSALAVADGRRVPIEISATPILRDGRCHGVRAIMRDVHERKVMEAQLIRAERLSSVGALAAGVAHEINNPLGIINMFAQRALEQGRKGEVDVDKLEKIVAQTRRVAKITKGLLDFSRAGPTDLQPFSMPDLVHETVSLIEERAHSSGVELSVSIAEELPPVVGNASQIGQVLLNLLLNALHAIERDGHVDVRVECAEPGRLPSDVRAIRVTVDDDGPGIPADVLPHLFEPFFTTKAPGEGTGLGLSVSYGILKEHHGILTASNRSEGGARFEIELPAPDA